MMFQSMHFGIALIHLLLEIYIKKNPSNSDHLFVFVLFFCFFDCVEDLLHRLDKSKIIDHLILDFSKAFDTVSHRCLLHILEHQPHHWHD